MNERQEQKHEQLDITWLLRASEIMRELWQKDITDAEVFATAAALYPEFALCSPDEKDWRVAAQVILQWRVHCLPHWFIDLFFQCPRDQVADMRAELRRNIENCTYGRGGVFWTELLALVPSATEETDDNTNAFVRLLVALRDGGRPDLVPYWNDCYCRAHPHEWYMTVSDAKQRDCFDRLVLPYKSLQCLDLVLAQAKRERCGVAGVAQSLFASDWRAGVARLVPFLQATMPASPLSAATFPVHALPPASHPAVLDWVLSNTRDAVVGMTVSRRTKLPPAFVRWIADSFAAMLDAGTLGRIHAEMGPRSAFRALRFMLSGHHATFNPRLLNAVARELRDALDRAVDKKDSKEDGAGGGGADDKMRMGSIHVMTWWLMTDPCAPLGNRPRSVDGRSGAEWSLRFEALRFADLLRWPPLDGELTAQLFVDHLRAAAPFMIVESRAATGEEKYQYDEDGSEEEEEKKKQGSVWLSGASVAHLRMALMVLREFGWFKRAEDLRPLAVRLAGEGVSCSRTNRRIVLAVSAEEFLAMVDDEDANKKSIVRSC